MLAAGVLVHRQNPVARPNWNFLVYMCLWAVSNVAVAEASFGPRKLSGAIIGLTGTLLPVHGWVLFLTCPASARRQAWLDRHRLIPRLYAAAFVLAGTTTVVFSVVWAAAPEFLARGWLYPVAQGYQVFLAVVSFPIKVAALLDARRRAASPLVNQQTTVLLLGIGLGLGCWLALMLLPLTHWYAPPVDPQVGSALVLLYPAAIAYATVRYRLFDAAVVLRRSIVYGALAALVAGAYALVVAGVNVVLAAYGAPARAPWVSGAAVFVVALALYPLRERMQRALDRTFFREGYDAVIAVQGLARSMATLLDLDEITRRLAATVEAVLHAGRPRLVVARPEPKVQALLAVAPGALTRYQVAADPAFAAVAPATLAAWRRLEAEVVVPLRFQGETRGLLLLGPRRSEAAYTAEDLALLETLADQTAVAVANAEAHRRVVDYAHELERSLLIRTSLSKFVSPRVRELIEASPEAPSLDKRETDVSVLFADITGYTRLSSRMPAEALDALVERYFAAFLDEIVRREGDVSETAGDGIMAIFHGDGHAVRAAGTARAIQQRTVELNAELAGRSEPIAMHIGVNSGPAALGATRIEGLTGAKWTYTATGLTVNVASRLAGLARGGEVVVSEATRERLGPGVLAEDLGPRELKNVEQPVRVWRLR